ncbi:hypothetical protein XA68_17348 [Ophiocordyceps unilateralis]|uniref:Uncharacterized protein n=1 Tax=Ophiocordyceps unilateralis TaxID=268505 RepID=A0A2A9PJN7_OPHUN|nr:hypothetical protein XA68_17348 [Ophiocordyceps unilateralis]
MSQSSALSLPPSRASPSSPLHCCWQATPGLPQQKLARDRLMAEIVFPMRFSLCRPSLRLRPPLVDSVSSLSPSLPPDPLPRHSLGTLCLLFVPCRESYRIESSMQNHRQAPSQRRRRPRRNSVADWPTAIFGLVVPSNPVANHIACNHVANGPFVMAPSSLDIALSSAALVGRCHFRLNNNTMECVPNVLLNQSAHPLLMPSSLSRCIPLAFSPPPPVCKTMVQGFAAPSFSSSAAA